LPSCDSSFRSLSSRRYDSMMKMHVRSPVSPDRRRQEKRARGQRVEETRTSETSALESNRGTGDRYLCVACRKDAEEGPKADCSARWRSSTCAAYNCKAYRQVRNGEIMTCGGFVLSNVYQISSALSSRYSCA
jgi:hypothetical protein